MGVCVCVRVRVRMCVREWGYGFVYVIGVCIREYGCAYGEVCTVKV